MGNLFVILLGLFLLFVFVSVIFCETYDRNESTSNNIIVIIGGILLAVYIIPNLFKLFL